MLILVFDTPEDRDKFVILYETYGKTIYYTLSRYNLDEHTKEDLSHDIYIILAEHLDSIDINDHKKTRNYIITITRNYCSNYLRSKCKAPCKSPVSQAFRGFLTKDTNGEKTHRADTKPYFVRKI